MDASKKNIGLLSSVVVIAIIVVAFLIWPAHQFTLDVNPSLEITTNRLERVTNIEALNDDAREFLEGYEMDDRNLEAVINGLVDRMILTGHISGGHDNIVMITVANDELHDAYVEKVNAAIAALLENRQLEYTILLQGWTETDDSDDDPEVSRGRRTLIKNLLEKNADLTYDELSQISLQDLLITAEQINVSPDELFARFTRGHVSDSENREVIGFERAIAIALEHVGGGTVTEFEYDRDDAEYEIEIYYNGYEYDLDIDAFTGDIKKFERERDDDTSSDSPSSQEVIGLERAIAIALERVGGGTVTEFEYDRDDAEYEVEISFNGREYDVEIDAFTGEIKKFEWERDDDAFSGAPSNQTVIGRDKAIEIALAKVGGGTIVEFEYDRDDAEYEIEIIFEGYEYELEIDAFTGEIKDFEQERKDDASTPSSSTQTVISRDKAIEIALTRIGGGTVVEFEYDREDAEYEIEIIFEGYEYELEIDAFTGEITDFEREKKDD